MLTADNIRKVLEPFSKDLKYVGRVKRYIFCAIFETSVDIDEVKKTLKENLNVEDVEVDKRESEISMRIYQKGNN